MTSRDQFNNKRYTTNIMNVLLLLFLGSLPFIFVSALEESSNQVLLTQSRLVRDIKKRGERLRQRKEKRKKKKKGNKKKKGKKRKKGKVHFSRRKPKKNLSQEDSRINTVGNKKSNSKNLKKEKRRRKEKGGGGASPVPSPSPTAAPPVACPSCPSCSCEDTIKEKSNGLKKAQNWLRQCKRITSQKSTIENKKGKSGAFMDAAMYLSSSTMNGTKCADGDSLANATATMNILKGCKSSVEAACTCSSTKQTNTTESPVTTAASAVTSAAPSSDKESKLKAIIDAYHVSFMFY